MEITQEIIDLFRVRQRAFADDNKWGDDTIEQALCEGDAETGSCRWGAYDTPCQNFKQRGMFLYAAHYIASMYPTGDAGSVSGGSKGAVSQKSVSDESVSYARATVLSQGDEWLGNTAFGQQFMRLRKRAGMGAVAV
jgi:hypothetical protein